MAIEISKNDSKQVTYENQPQAKRALFPNLGDSLPYDELKEIIEEWLEDNPEYTTTVEDGSLLPVKLDSENEATANYVLGFDGTKFVWIDLQANFADEFDSSHVGGYTTGDYVMHEGQMYVFTADHTGNWDASDVQAVSVESIASNIQEQIDDLKQDLNAITNKPNPEWEIGAYISASGSVVRSDGYATRSAISNMITVQPGDVVDNSASPKNDGSGHNVTNFLNFYIDGVWQSRVGIHTYPVQTIPDNVNGIRFSVTVATVTMTETILAYAFKTKFYLKPASYTDWLKIKEALRPNPNNITVSTANYNKYFTDANNAPANMEFVVVGAITSSHITNLPEYGTNGLLITFSGMVEGTNVKLQVFTTSKNTYFRKCNYQGTWNNWERIASLFGGYITATNYADFFTDADNAPLNKIYGIQAIMDSTKIANLPEYNMATQANLITLCGRDTNDGSMNALQIYSVGSGGKTYIRSSNYDRTTWSKWLRLVPEEIYHVGADGDYTSLTECLYDLRNDTHKKTIYVDGGVYDIEQEYADANIPVIPDDGDYNNDYGQYNVWIPENTHLIGRGNVLIKYCPDTEDVSEAESKAVSPLNINKSCVVENVTVECKNGRYCIHIDNAGSRSYDNAIVTLKNVHCIKHTNDTGKGWGETVGIGLDMRQSLHFDSCVFETENTGACFFAHNRNVAGSTTLTQADSADMTIVNCVFVSSSALTDMIRLQSRSTTNLLEIPVKVIGCHVGGGIHLQSNSSGVSNCFNLLLLNSGTPNIVVDDTDNAYPIQQY